jgi:uncharacterized protein YqhQ
VTEEKTHQERLPQYGGQALIEGVLMRGRYALAAAMRAPDGQIVVHTERLSGIYTGKWFKIPFIRGLVSLWDALGLGMRFLVMSANIQGSEDEKIEGKEMTMTLAASLLIFVAIFFAAPAFLAGLTERYLGFSSFAGNFTEGIIRLAAIILYLVLVSRMPEIARVFAYHGAEHKTINAFEDRAELSPKKVLTYSLEHPRCGTAFILTLFVLSFIIFILLGDLPFLVRLASRIVMIPLLAGIAYEYIRWTSRHLDNPMVRWIVRPNLALQHLTTREPDEGIAEVAICAFNAMLEKELEWSPKGETQVPALNEPLPVGKGS